MELPSIIYILLFSLQLVLGTRIYLISPDRTLYRLHSLAMFVASITIFVEYEIAKSDQLEVVRGLSQYHTSANISLVCIFVIISWLFARPFRNYRYSKWLNGIPLTLITVSGAIIVIQLLTHNFYTDSDLRMTDGLWTYRLSLDSLWAYAYVTWFAAALGMISMALYRAYNQERFHLYRYWKFILFIIFTLVTLYLFVMFIWSPSTMTESRADYTMSPYLGLLTLFLSWTFTNFKLFEVTPTAAINNILGSMTNLVIITDNNFRVKYANQAVEKEFNVNRDKVNEQMILDLFRSDIREEFIPSMRKIRNLKSNDRFTQEFSFELDGEMRHYLLIITPIDNANIIRSGFTFVGINLTKLKENQAKLEASNRQLERFAYIASHDLKSPLRNIVSFLGLIKRKVSKIDDPSLQEYMEFATSNATSMYRLIEDILEFSRMRKEQKGEHQVVDLNLVIQQIQNTIKDYFENYNCEFECPELPTIMANPTQMLQLFQNLIENGFKYNESELRRVRVKVQEVPGKLVFSIQDNGIGIEESFLNDIFEIFKRLHSNNEYPGSGVGLAICKHIVEEHHGEITVISEPGKGSTFTFSIPQKKVTPELATAEVDTVTN